MLTVDSGTHPLQFFRYLLFPPFLFPFLSSALLRPCPRRFRHPSLAPRPSSRPHPPVAVKVARIMNQHPRRHQTTISRKNIYTHAL